MAIVSVLADPILLVFAIMAFGYFMGWFGKTTVEQAQVINQFAMSILLPILIFGLIARAPIHEFSIVPVSVYFGSEAVIFTIGCFLAQRLFKCGPGESVLLGDLLPLFGPPRWRFSGGFGSRSQTGGKRKLAAFASLVAWPLKPTFR